MKKQQIRISFDLDGVLFVNPDKIETEPSLRFPLMRFYPDHVRKGTVQLIRQLREENFSVWVYTSSYRSEFYIRRLFRHYRVKFDQIINGYRHDREVQKNRKERVPSKLPNYYQIALHIDDEENVIKNALHYGYNALRVCEQDPLWAEKIIQEANRIRDLENKKTFKLFHK